MKITELIRQLNKIKKKDPETEIKLLINDRLSDIKLSKSIHYVSKESLVNDFKDISPNCEIESNLKTKEYNSPLVVIGDNFER